MMAALAVAFGMEDPLRNGVHATARILIDNASLNSLPCRLSTLTRVHHPEVDFDASSAILVRLRGHYFLRRVFGLGVAVG